MILELLAEFWPIILAAGGVLFAYVKGRGDGKSVAESKVLNDRIKAIEQKKEDEDEVSDLDDTSLADRITRMRD